MEILIRTFRLILSKCSAVQQLVLLACVLGPLFLVFSPFADLSTSVAIDRAVKNTTMFLAAIISISNSINCFLAVASYRCRRDLRVLVPGITAAALLCNQYYGFFYESAKYPVAAGSLLWLQLLALAASIAACLLYRQKKRPSSPIVCWLYAALLLNGCSTLLLFLTSGSTGAVLLANLLYQAGATFCLLIVLWRIAVEFPNRSVSRLGRLRQTVIDRQLAQISTLEQNKIALAASISNKISRINSSSKLTYLLDELVSEVSQTLGSDYILVSLLEGNPRYFWVVAYKGSFQPQEVPVDLKFMGGQYAAGQIVRLGDLTEFLPDLPPEISQAGLQAMVGLPIMVDSVLAGSLEVFFSRPEAISEYQCKLAAGYADEVALAVKLARQNDHLVKKGDELNLLHEVARIVENQPSPSLLLTRVGKLLSDFLHADAFAAFIVQNYSALPSIRQVHLQNYSTADIVRLESWFTQFVQGQLQHTSSADSSFGMGKSFSLVTVTSVTGKTIQAMPLHFRQTLHGVITFRWDYERDTTSQSSWEVTLQTVAQQTAMGLDRDRLYGNITQIGLTDTLTKIANRRCFDYILKRELNKLRRNGRSLSLLMVDIDFFKNINDTWGHQAGDMVLRDIGDLLKNGFRSIDLPARYGGEEFAVILPDTGQMDALSLAEKLRRQVEKNIFAAPAHSISLTVSIGTVTVESHDPLEKLTEADLIFAADQALYQAKHTGRNRVEVSTPIW